MEPFDFQGTKRPVTGQKLVHQGKFPGVADVTSINSQTGKRTAKNFYGKYFEK